MTAKDDALTVGVCLPPKVRITEAVRINGYIRFRLGIDGQEEKYLAWDEKTFSAKHASEQIEHIAKKFGWLMKE